MTLEEGLIPKSYWGNLKSYLPPLPPSKRSKQAFTENEINAVFEAFRTDCFLNPKSAYKHSFYADLIEFIFLTACRPGEAIALRWNDVESNCIIFSKSYSKGVLKGTKNNTVRRFPINAQLRQLLDKRCPISVRNPGSLVFPAQEGGYIDVHNFTNRYWRPVVKALVAEGKVKTYLPLYNERNTSASFYIRKGVDMTTLANLMETSEEMLQEHYLAPDHTIQLPEI